MEIVAAEVRPVGASKHSTYLHVTSSRSHFSVTGYRLLTSRAWGSSLKGVNEAGRLSMASPPNRRPARRRRWQRFALRTTLSQRTQERSMTPPDSPLRLHTEMEPRRA